MPYPLRRPWRRFVERLREKTRGPKILFVTGRQAQYEALWRRAAEALGAELAVRAPGLWEVRHGGRATWICNHKVELDSPPVLEICGRKPLVHRLLADAGLPVPEHEVLSWRARERGLAFVARADGPCVVKPATGTGSGMGITTHVETPQEYDRAAILASLHARELLVERQVAGEAYRLLVLGGELVHAVRRSGVRVTGDGRRTVRELAGGDLDRDARFTLKAQGLAADTVPGPSAEILVRSSDPGAWRREELLTAYDADATALLGPAVREAAERAARAVRAELVGVDLITTDPARPLAETGGRIVELNSAPGLHHHEVPPGNDAAQRVLAYVLGKQSSGAQG